MIKIHSIVNDKIDVLKCLTRVSIQLRHEIKFVTESMKSKRIMKFLVKMLIIKIVLTSINVLLPKTRHCVNTVHL